MLITGMNACGTLEERRCKPTPILRLLVAATAVCAPSGAQTFTTLVSFDITNGNGTNENAPLVQGTDGNLYGVNFGGGTAKGGTFFKVSLSGTLTTLTNFPAGTGSQSPRGGVVQGSDGNFYGTTENGGNGGTIFKVTPAGLPTTTYLFGTQPTDGTQPQGALVQATDASFYGLTLKTVFKVSAAGALTTIYSGGQFPPGNKLIQAMDGNLYGIAGANNGSIFKITPSGALTTVYTFGTASTDGVAPTGWLVQGTDGNFYGVTKNGGTGESGTFFRLTQGGNLTTLHSFVAKTDGSVPVGGLIQASDGNFYGTTVLGGANSHGTIYKITPTGILTTLYSFASADGNVSSGGLVQANDGQLYGTTGGGGPGGGGTVFKLTLSAQSSPPPPTINENGVVPVYSAVSTIQQGEWISIYGANLAATTATWNGDFPKTLAETSVTVDGKSAYLWFVSSAQINAQTPDDTATGTVPVVVTTAGGTATTTVTLAQVAPSFSLLDAEHVAGIIPRPDGSGTYGNGTYDILGPTGNSLGYPTVAAKAGDTVELFGVGFGPTNSPAPAGAPYSGSAQTNNPVMLVINNQTVTPSYAGETSAGLYQINVTQPKGLGTGDLPLRASVIGIETPTGVVISLQ